VLSGAVGSGKTPLLLQIGALLEERDEPYALIDLDWLACVRAATGSERTVGALLGENLHAVWGVYCRVGVRRLVMARHGRRPAGARGRARDPPDRRLGVSPAHSPQMSRAVSTINSSLATSCS
jgi:hypothetical protein